MNLQDLREQLQENLITYVEGTNGLDGFGTDDIKDSLCQIVVDTFNTAVFAPDPCTHYAVYENPDFENLTCLECGSDVEPSDD